jgi:hypothetical protein
MAHLDLNGWLSLVSTVAVVVALVFAGLQVRQANSQRRDQAAMAFIQSAQGDGWTDAMRRMSQLPADATADVVDAGGDEALIGLMNFGVRLETIGYMVHLRLVSLAMVDDLLGGMVLVFWSRARAWVLRERERTGNPKLWEWCQWLADRVTERRAARGHVPAHVRYGRPLP